MMAHIGGTASSLRDRKLSRNSSCCRNPDCMHVLKGRGVLQLAKGTGVRRHNDPPLRKLPPGVVFVLREKTLPSCKTNTTPLVQKNTPLMQNTLPSCKKTTPRAKKTPLMQKKPLPSCKKHSPRAKNPTPLVQKTLPSCKKHSPRAKSTPLMQKNPNPTPLMQKNPLPSCKKHSPHAKKTTPLVQKALPSCKKTTPLMQKTLPLPPSPPHAKSTPCALCKNLKNTRSVFCIDIYSPLPVCQE